MQIACANGNSSKQHQNGRKIYTQNEEQSLTNSKNESDKTTFDVKNTFFIPSKKLNQEVTNDPSWQVIKGYNVNTTGNMEYITDDENSLETFTQTVNLRFRLFKRYLGFLFSVGYT